VLKNDPRGLNGGFCWLSKLHFPTISDRAAGADGVQDYPPLHPQQNTHTHTFADLPQRQEPAQAKPSACALLSESVLSFSLLSSRSPFPSHTA